MSRLVMVLFVALFLLLCLPSARAEESEPQFIPLYQYKPIYFLLGQTYTKIEVSFKVQVINTVPVYFGYTQLMMWDLFTPSPFFYDLNYNPEAFYRFFISSGTKEWIDFGPLDHESNGKGGSDERSWDQVYLRYHTLLKLDERSKLYCEFKLLYPYWLNPNNSDLPQYRGVWELGLTLSDFLGPFFGFGDLSLRLYPGGASYTNPLHGGQELTFRAKAANTKLVPRLVAQLFHGYGENLLSYGENRFVLRAGFGF